jgi:hypothetical protein
VQRAAVERCAVVTRKLAQLMAVTATQRMRALSIAAPVPPKVASYYTTEGCRVETFVDAAGTESVTLSKTDIREQAS